MKIILGHLKNPKLELESRNELISLLMSVRKQIEFFTEHNWDKDPDMKDEYQRLLNIKEKLDSCNKTPW